MPDPTPPAIAAEIARLLAAAGETVRSLRARGFGGRTAEALLGKGDGLPSLESADEALRLVLRRRQWHRPDPQAVRPRAPSVKS